MSSGSVMPRDHREHVERRTPPEHRGTVDDSTLVASQSVELTAHDLRQCERQRLRGERVGLGAPRRAQDLLKEERVATGSRVQRIGRLRRKRTSVHTSQERGHVGVGEPVEPQVVHCAPPVEAHEEIGRGKEASELVRPVRAQQHRTARHARRESLEHAEALGVGPVQILEDDHRTASRDAVHQHLNECAESVRAVGHSVDAQGVEGKLERTTQRAGLGLSGKCGRAGGEGRAELAEQPRLADACLADDQRDRGV